jgi:diguanylate cyclase (GGDEF)-like protein/PAS domain S-box-containing protein
MVDESTTGFRPYASGLRNDGTRTVALVSRSFLLKPRAPAAMIAAFVMLVSLGVYGLVSWNAWNERDATLARSARNIQNLVHSLAEHASRAIENIDVILFGIVERLEHDGLDANQVDRMEQLLAARVSASPQIRELAVFDERGNWILSSLAVLPSHNNADRDYFVFHRDHTDPSLRINQPLKSRANGKWTILLTRRVNHRDGSFAGIVSAAIDLDYFQAFFATFDIGRHGGIGLYDNDGTLFVRRPFEAANVGRNLSDIKLFDADIRATPTGSYLVRSPLDGIDRMIAYEHLSEFPMVVTIGLAEDEVLADWRANVRNDFLIASLLAAVTALMGALIAAQFRLRAKSQRSLRESETRYRLLAENVGDVVIRLDLDGTRRYVSPSVEQVLGWKPEQLTGRSALDLQEPHSREALAKLIGDMGQGLESARLSTQACRIDGAYVWVETTFKLTRDAATGAPREIVGVLRDISQQKAAEQQLERAIADLRSLAATDALTGLANRRSFDVALERESRRAARAGQRLSLLFIDIDKFKDYNDSYGHPAGDECMREVARTILQTFRRPGDLSARYGGEEFAIILPETDESGAKVVAETLRSAVHGLGLRHQKGPAGVLTISVGVACTGETHDSDGALLVQAADRSLYQAKNSGRNKVVCASEIPRLVRVA